MHICDYRLCMFRHIFYTFIVRTNSEQTHVGAFCRDVFHFLLYFHFQIKSASTFQAQCAQATNLIWEFCDCYHCDSYEISMANFSSNGFVVRACVCNFYEQFMCALCTHLNRQMMKFTISGSNHGMFEYPNRVAWYELHTYRIYSINAYVCCIRYTVLSKAIPSIVMC